MGRGSQPGPSPRLKSPIRSWNRPAPTPSRQPPKTTTTTTPLRVLLLLLTSAPKTTPSLPCASFRFHLLPSSRFKVPVFQFCLDQRLLVFQIFNSLEQILLSISGLKGVYVFSSYSCAFFSSTLYCMYKSLTVKGAFSGNYQDFALGT